MPKNLWSKRFDPSDAFVWRRSYGDNNPGDPVVNSEFTTRRLRQLYEGRMIVAADVWNEFVGASSPAPDKARVVVDSAPVSDAGNTLDELRSRAESLGIVVDKRWGEKRLRDEIQNAKSPSLPGVNDGAA